MKYASIVRILCLAIAVSAVNTNIAQAYSATYPSPGQDSSFVVSFNGEGEAAVAAQLRYRNYTEETQTLVTLSIPGKNVRVSRVIQQYWDRNEADYSDVVYAILKPTVSQDGDVTNVEVPLKKPLETQGSTVVYLSYKAGGYVTQKPFGLFSYTYTTPKFPHEVDRVSVSIYADPTLYLKTNGQAKVGYAPKALESINSVSLSDKGSLQGPSLMDSFNSSYQYDSSLVKTSQNLDPNDTLSVSGAYATSAWRLIWVYLLMALLGVLFVIAIIVIGERRMAKINNIRGK